MARVSVRTDEVRSLGRVLGSTSSDLLRTRRKIDVCQRSTQLNTARDPRVARVASGTNRVEYQLGQVSRSYDRLGDLAVRTSRQFEHADRSGLRSWRLGLLRHVRFGRGLFRRARRTFGMFFRGVKAGRSLLGRVTAGLRSRIGLVRGVGRRLLDGSRGLLGRIGGWLSGAKSAIGERVDDTKNWVQQGWSWAKDGIKRIWNWGRNKLTQLVSKAWNKIWGGLTATFRVAFRSVASLAAKALNVLGRTIRVGRWLANRRIGLIIKGFNWGSKIWSWVKDRWNGSTNGPKTGPKTPEPETAVYTVRAGDTLGAIAVRYNTTVAALANANNITNINLIYPGQQLKLDQQPTAAQQPPKPDEAEISPSSPGATTGSTDTSKGIATRVGKSVAVAETGARYGLVHFDSNRLNFGIGSWTQHRVTSLLDLYQSRSNERNLSTRLYGHFGSKASFQQVMDALRDDRSLSAAQHEMLRSLGGDTQLQFVQDEQLAIDIQGELRQIGQDSGYPFVTDGSISEIAAHVLVHAAHQAGSYGLRTAISEVRATIGSGASELEFLKGIRNVIVGRVQQRYAIGVTNRYNTLFSSFGDSDERFVF